MGPAAAERQHLFSFDDYVELAARAEQRLEFWDGVILDMSGGSPRHSAICSNLGRVLGEQLRGKPCRAFDANLKVRSLATNRATYADVTVVCGPLEIDPADRTKQTVLNPSILIEVLSPSTESDDRGPKLDCYKSISSVRVVLLVSQDLPKITVFERTPNGPWSETKYTGGAAALSAIGCVLPLDEVYENLP